MLFNSIIFAIFLPLVFALYWTAFNRELRLRNLFIVAVSYLFYGWWDWRFLGLIVLSSLVDFSLALRMGQTDDQVRRKRLLWLSLICNLGILGFFKYFNFFTEQVAYGLSMLGWQANLYSLKIILPVGISFYTFQTLSYTIDVYRRDLEPTRDWTVFFAYVSFFPQLVAGPIERATQLLPQFQTLHAFDYEQSRDGMRQILWGLAKKVIIADNCAVLVENIFADPGSQSSSTLVLGAVLFAFQIYGDFSGYSDIAIGTARLFGFRLMRNFAYPYFARDIAEFWRRWHISLSTWFRDYLYIPLGGSRVNTRAKLIRNIAAIFLVSGFWHGANWTFIVWGALHAAFFLPGILLGTNRRFLAPIPADRWLPSLTDALRILITFSLVCLAWIFFRAESVQVAWTYIVQMLTDFSFAYRPLRKAAMVLIFIMIMLAMEWWQRSEQHGLANLEQRWPQPIRGTVYLTLALAIMVFAPNEASVFIYFQF